MNVAVICLDDEYGAEFAKNIAELIDFNFVNFNDVLVAGLAYSSDFPIDKSCEEMSELETEELNNVVKQEKVVMAIPNDAFLSNENYKVFNGVLTICVEIPLVEKIYKNIQKLIKKHCKIAIKQEKIDSKSIKNNILKYFN